MKVESSKTIENGYVNGSQPTNTTSPSGTLVKRENIDCEGGNLNVPMNGTALEEIQEDTMSFSSESPYSISDVISNEDDSFSSLYSDSNSINQEHEISDFDNIVTSEGNAHHASAALEAFLENLEFVPAEVNRLLKLIGLLDERCEEITELLDRPCEDWFQTRQNKKQKKYKCFEDDELAAEEDSIINVHSTRALLVCQKIYEGQKEINFDSYISKLKKAKKLERQKELVSRSIDFSAIDNSFQIRSEKSCRGDLETNGELSPQTQETTHIVQNGAIKTQEGESVTESSQNTKSANVKRERVDSDPIDHYFSQFDKDDGQFNDEDMLDRLIELEGIEFDARSMCERWKEKLEDIRKENALNQKPINDIGNLDKFMEDKLSLLWRYTLRKKALTRKLYETTLYHYATLLQELEPQKFAASLGCYPEATIIQNMLLNDLEEEFTNPKEMIELYKDVNEMVDQFDEKELISNPIPQMPLVMKAKDTTVGLVSSSEVDRNVDTMETPRPDKQSLNNCFPRQIQGNGTASTLTNSGGSIPGYDRSDVLLPNGSSGSFRRARNKRHKPTKPPAGMAHAAKSPQSTGRLLTYHDIATITSSAKLSGHPAELFWPDDDLWYLIRINTIDPETKTANIVYTTGETERLELDDIVREGHMSLLPEAEDTDCSVEEGCMPRQTNECEANEDAMSDLSASEAGAMFSEDRSIDGDDEDCGTDDDDDDDEIVNLHHHHNHHHHNHHHRHHHNRRPPRRTEIKSERIEIHHKS